MLELSLEKLTQRLLSPIFFQLEIWGGVINIAWHIFRNFRNRVRKGITEEKCFHKYDKKKKLCASDVTCQDQQDKYYVRENFSTTAFHHSTCFFFLLFFSCAHLSGERPQANFWRILDVLGIRLFPFCRNFSLNTDYHTSNITNGIAGLETNLKDRKKKKKCLTTTPFHWH